MSSDVGRRVVCAAIRSDAGGIICSPRHWDELTRKQAMDRDPNGYRSWLSAEQGFVDQRGVFMSRAEALLVARAAGQIIRRCGGDERELFSENLY